MASELMKKMVDGMIKKNLDEMVASTKMDLSMRGIMLSDAEETALRTTDREKFIPWKIYDDKDMRNNLIMSTAKLLVRKYGGEFEDPDKVTSVCHEKLIELTEDHGISIIAYQGMPLMISDKIEGGRVLSTCSTPEVVSNIARELDIEGKGPLHILEIGAGCAYQDGVMKNLNPEISITGLEIDNELANFTQRNIQQFGWGESVKIIGKGGFQGYKENAPYDRILFTAEAPQKYDFQPLIEQLRDGTGIVLLPQENSLVKRTYENGKEVDKNVIPNFYFVPLREDKATTQKLILSKEVYSIPKPPR